MICVGLEKGVLGKYAGTFCSSPLLLSVSFFNPSALEDVLLKFFLLEVKLKKNVCGMTIKKRKLKQLSYVISYSVKSLLYIHLECV